MGGLGCDAVRNVLRQTVGTNHGDFDHGCVLPEGTAL